MTKREADLIERLRAQHARMLRYRLDTQYDPADWEPDDDLYSEAADALEALTDPTAGGG